MLVLCRRWLTRAYSLSLPCPTIHPDSHLGRRGIKNPLHRRQIESGASGGLANANARRCRLGLWNRNPTQSVVVVGFHASTQPTRFWVGCQSEFATWLNRLRIDRGMLHTVLAYREF